MSGTQPLGSAVASCFDQPLDLELGSVVAQRYNVHTDDGDVDQMRAPGSSGRRDKVARRRAVPALSGGAVDNRVDVGEGSVESGAAAQVTGRPGVLVGVDARLRPAAEHPGPAWTCGIARRWRAVILVGPYGRPHAGRHLRAPAPGFDL